MTFYVTEGDHSLSTVMAENCKLLVPHNFFKAAKEKELGLREVGPHIPDVNRSPLPQCCKTM